MFTMEDQVKKVAAVRRVDQLFERGEVGDTVELSAGGR